MYAPIREGRLTVNQVMVEGEWIRFKGEREKNQFKAALMIAQDPERRARLSQDVDHMRMYRP